MRSRFLSRSTRHWLISLLLVAVSVRALIPAGFMPSPDHPFTLQICPDGFPAQLLQQSPAHSPAGHEGHHGHDHAGMADAPEPDHGSPAHQHESPRAEHCVFAAAAGAGPLAQTPIIAAAADPGAAPRSVAAPPVFESHRFRIQQPRGPPALS